MDTFTRIAVVGAGLGGLACARGLQLHGRSVTVFEREPSRYARSQDGTLDLHADTGQAALHAVGLFDQFRAVARYDGQEQCVIDRGQLRDVFLDSLTEGTVQWGRAVTGVTSYGDGTSSLAFADGVTLDFDLVIGADGAWSRIRPAVSDVVPVYAGSTLVETYLDDVDTRHPALARLVGNGTMVAAAHGRTLFAQRDSGGRIRVYAELAEPLNWHVVAGLDIGDTEAVRAHLLGVFDGWHDDLLGLLRDSDGGFLNRPLYVLPIGHRWEHVPGVTLLGDAAHLMSPAGIGANLALLDGIDLADALAMHSTVDDAVRGYESIMFVRSAAAAQACADAASSHLNERILNAS